MANEVESSLVPGEQAKIDAAKAALAADPHASREVLVKVRLHQHNEYPKMLYKGKQNIVVQSEEEKDKAEADGYGPFVPEVPKEE